MKRINSSREVHYAIAVVCALSFSASGCSDDDGGGGTDAGQNQNDAATQQDGAPQTDGQAQTDGGGGGDCASMCALVMTCPNVADRDQLFGTTAGQCETLCGSTMEQYLKDCALAASGCAELEECARCQDWNDIGFCRNGACDLWITQCGEGTDLSQCYIDCEMIGSGALGCFRGAGRMCWEDAALNQDCQAAQDCPSIH